MIGMRGGVVGVGTDIGGSIRVPAAFNALYGIRPSHGRLPYGKMANSMEGQETVHSVVGPIAHSAADLRLFLTSVLGEEPWKYDSKVIPMPWRSSEEEAVKAKIKTGLTVGYFNCDGNVSLEPDGLPILLPVLNFTGPSPPTNPPRHRPSRVRHAAKRPHPPPLDPPQSSLRRRSNKQHLRRRRLHRRLPRHQRLGRAPNPQHKKPPQSQPPQIRHERPLGHAPQEMELPDGLPIRVARFRNAAWR